MKKISFKRVLEKANATYALSKFRKAGLNKDVVAYMAPEQIPQIVSDQVKTFGAALIDELNQILNVKSFVITHSRDIPENWTRRLAKKIDTVTVRELRADVENFKVHYDDDDDDIVVANKVDDVVLKGVDGNEYPCKRDIFADTYEQVDDTEFYIKKRPFVIVEIPRNVSVDIKTLEGDIMNITCPSYIAIGPKSEVYPLTIEYVLNSLKIVS